MAPFDRPHKMSSYLSSLVAMANSCIVSEIKWDIDWKSRFFHPLPHHNPRPAGNGCQ